MKDAMILLFRLLAVIARLLRPGGGRTLVAENLLLKQHLLLHSRSRSRAPNLSTLDRVLPGFWTVFLNPGRIARVGIIVQAETLMKFHDALNKRKYRLLYSCKKQTGTQGSIQR
jgi:putative transposase